MMKMKMLFCLINILSFLSCIWGSPPNIVLIVADDLGWDDVGFHGSEIKTPNIDTLAYDGIILNNYYVQPICTPSRSALLSGRHPIHTGLQHGVITSSKPYGLGLGNRLLSERLRELSYRTHIVGKKLLEDKSVSSICFVGLQHSVILSSQPYGLDLSDKLLSDRLKQAGYSTHMVGKWHLGFMSWNYTPTLRGFDSHYGYFMGKQDYWDHTNIEGNKDCCWGLDFHDDRKLVRSEFGRYSTKLYEARAKKIISEHDTSKPLFLYLPFQSVHSANSDHPLEAPQEYVDRFSYIPNKNRRIFAGMVAAMDDAIGNVTEALHARGMLENSVIIFTTDNGGPAAGFDVNMACNWPLRGVKSLVWEGGVKGSSFIWSPLLKKSGYTSQHMMQIFDWYPTLLSIAGYDMQSLDPSKIDGMDMWRTLSVNDSSPRTEMLHNIDPISGQRSLRVANYKLIQGESPKYWAGWYKPGQHGVKGKDYLANEVRNDLQMTYDILEGESKISGVYFKPELSPRLSEILESLGRLANNKAEPVIVDCGKPRNASSCDSTISPCLFDIEADPCEFNNIADQHPHIVKELKERLESYEKTMVTPKNKHLLPDPKGFPVNNGWAWVPWINVTNSGI